MSDYDYIMSQIRSKRSSRSDYRSKRNTAYTELELFNEALRQIKLIHEEHISVINSTSMTNLCAAHELELIIGDEIREQAMDTLTGSMEMSCRSQLAMDIASVNNKITSINSRIESYTIKIGRLSDSIDSLYGQLEDHMSM